MEKIRVSAESPTLEFFMALGLEKAGRYARILKRYKIFSVAQFYGTLTPYLPGFSRKEIVKKGLAANYGRVRKRALHPQARIEKICRLFNISSKKARQILAGLEAIPYISRECRVGRSYMSFGLKRSGGRTKRMVRGPVAHKAAAAVQYLLPEYERMGPVFDQGARGTCVANAATSMVDYICGNCTSRQFLYHQCKMIDGDANQDGTYMWCPITILCDEQLIDYGSVAERDWEYNETRNSANIPQGPAPEKCFRTRRFFSSRRPLKVRKATVIQDIKSILSNGDGHGPVPVIMGFDIHESFQSYYTARTGEVSLPLPGEACLGGHAMVIVGWNDTDEVFIVRNSWGLRFAPENRYGLPGHALIPYAYFKKYAHGGFAITSVNGVSMLIAGNKRLYNKVYHRKKFGKRAAAVTGRAVSGRRRKRRTGSGNYPVLAVLTGLVVLVAFIRTYHPDAYSIYLDELRGAYGWISSYMEKVW